MDFATNLRRICAEKGTTMTEVCKQLGVSTSKVTLWNNGSLPKEHMLVKLAQHLECTVMDFFADDVSKVEFALDDDERDIIRLFRTLDRKQKHAFMVSAYHYEETMMANKEE